MSVPHPSEALEVCGPWLRVEGPCCREVTHDICRRCKDRMDREILKNYKHSAGAEESMDL